MTYIATEVADSGVATLIIDRQEKRNALSIAVRNEMSDALDKLAGNDAVKVVVIASTGPIFCAGFDLKEFSDKAVLDDLIASSERWHERVRSFPLPLVASIQGPALAGGFDLAMMCDLRVAGTSATFGRPELTWTNPIYSILHDLVGGALARELTFTTRTLTATDALEYRLVTKVVGDEELREATQQLAEEVARAPRSVLANTKSTIIAAAKISKEASFAW